MFGWFAKTRQPGNDKDGVIPGMATTVGMRGFLQPLCGSFSRPTPDPIVLSLRVAVHPGCLAA